MNYDGHMDGNGCLPFPAQVFHILSFSLPNRSNQTLKGTAISVPILALFYNNHT